MTDARKTMALALDALHAMENAMLDRGVHTDPEHPYRQALNFACTARNALRAALEQQAEPVQYEMRMRPTWEANSWSNWQKCSKESAGDYIKTPKLHDWLYEVRALYTSPTQRKPLTDAEIAAIVREAAKGSSIRRDGSTSERIARAVEAKLKEKKYENNT